MFHQNKYTNWYFRIVENAKSQKRNKTSDGIYYEKHHITPDCMGGKEIVLLTAKEHYIVHILLPKMVISTKHQQQMLNALFRMRQKNKYQKERYFNSLLYDQAKKHMIYSEERKEKHRNKVVCKIIGTEEYLQVSSEEFHSNTSLVGINTGRSGQKRTDEFKLSRMGEKNSFFGKKHSDASKKKAAAGISKALKGKPKSEEHRQKMREAWIKRKASL